MYVFDVTLLTYDEQAFTEKKSNNEASRELFVQHSTLPKNEEFYQVTARVL